MTTSVSDESLADDKLCTISLMDDIVPFLHRVSAGTACRRGSQQAIHLEISADEEFATHLDVDVVGESKTKL